MIQLKREIWISIWFSFDFENFDNKIDGQDNKT